MKCVICHGEDVQAADLREEVSVASDIVYVPIRVPVCGSCGERYYDRRTVQYLEQAEEKLKAGKAKVQEVGKILVME